MQKRIMVLPSKTRSCFRCFLRPFLNLQQGCLRAIPRHCFKYDSRAWAYFDTLLTLATLRCRPTGRAVRSIRKSYFNKVYSLASLQGLVLTVRSRLWTCWPLQLACLPFCCFRVCLDNPHPQFLCWCWCWSIDALNVSDDDDGR
jgi:hypothetical protein